MGLFSKKKEETSLLPDLPESNVGLPRLPQYGAAANLNSDVPMNNNGMGNMPMNQGTNEDSQNAIKNEIHNNNNLQKSQFEPLPHYEGQGMPARIVAEPAQVMEDHEEHHEIGNNKIIEPRAFEMQNNTKIPSNTKSARPIYIRLDKFKAGLESFEDIKGKLTEIEDLLVKIREMKEKEERELEEWEREIQVVKARIEQIDNDVFKNVE